MQWISVLLSFFKALAGLISGGIVRESERADRASAVAKDEADMREREYDAAQETSARPDADAVSQRLQQGRF